MAYTTVLRIAGCGIAVLVLCVACAGRSVTPTGSAGLGGEGESTQSTVLSPFPIAAPSVVYASQQLEKSASSVLSCEGSDYEPGYCQHVTAEAPKAILSPAWENGQSTFDSIAYAIYRFDLTARVGRITVNTQWAHAPADYGKLWIGISNWDKDRWDWYSGAPGGVVQALPSSLEWYRRADTGATLVTVVLLGQTSASLKAIWLDGFSMRGDLWMEDRNAQRDACSIAIGPAYPSLEWSLSIASTSAPVYDVNGVIYIFARGTSDVWLTTVSPAGELLWTKAVAAAPEGRNCAAALGDDGTVYSAFGDKLLACTPEGTLLWEYPMPGVYTLGLAIALDSALHADVLDADGSEHHYAVRPDGTLSWEYHQDGSSPSSASAISQDGIVYLSTNQGLISLSPDGSVNWTYSIDPPYSSSPCIAPNGTVYINDFNNNELCAIHPDGSLAWSAVIAGNPAGEPALGPSGEILVWDESGGLSSYTSLGDLQWRHEHNVGFGSFFQPLATDGEGTSYFIGGDTLLFAVDASGAVNWWRETYAPNTSKLCLGEDGTIYFRDSDNLYAIGTGGSTSTHQVSGYVKDGSGNGIAGVCIAISGKEAVSTDATGYWRRDGLADGSYAIAPVMSGLSFHPELTTVDVAGGNVIVPDFIGEPATAIWPMFGGNAQHTRRCAATGPSTPALSWSANLHNLIQSEPMITFDGSLIVNSSFDLHCYAADGTERWVVGNGDLSSSKAAAIGLDQAINVPGSALFTYSPAGTLVWTQLPAGGAAAIAADGGILQVSEGVRKLAADGSFLWQSSPADWRSSTTTPAIAADGTIYCGNGKDALYAFSSNGEVEWRADAVPDTGAPYWQSSPAIAADGTIYLGSGKNLYAINADGSQQWVYPNTVPITMSPAIASDGTVYYTTGESGASANNLLLALNPDGSLKWQYLADTNRFTSPPTIDAAGTVYVGLVGALHAVNPDGSRKWTFEDPQGDVPGISIGADGTLYFGDTIGYFYALGEDGS